VGIRTSNRQQIVHYTTEKNQIKTLPRHGVDLNSGPLATSRTTGQQRGEGEEGEVYRRETGGDGGRRTGGARRRRCAPPRRDLGRRQAATSRRRMLASRAASCASRPAASSCRVVAAVGFEPEGPRRGSELYYWYGLRNAVGVVSFPGRVETNAIFLLQMDWKRSIEIQLDWAQPGRNKRGLTRLRRLAVSPPMRSPS
jgi:hypothetical protein